MQRDDFSENLPVTRGQWREIAGAALDRMGEPAPRNRLDATTLLTRFHAGADTAADRSRAVAAPNGR